MNDSKNDHKAESQTGVKPVILVVDDEETIRSCLKEALEGEGYKVYIEENGKNSLSLIKRVIPDLVLVDLKMPGMNGIDLLREVKTLDRNILVILLTGHGSVDTAVTAIKAGAFDYLEKPFKIEHIKVVVGKALSTQSLMREVIRLREKAGVIGFENVIAVSKEMKKVFEHVKIIAKSPSSTVLIQGESGTGKELIANYIHTMSSRSNYRFVDINCAALTENLLEAELFGYEKGAFTGASSTGKSGLFEVAQRGSIFLDEIGEMSMPLQAKLLRVLQEKRFKRVGGIDDIDVDVRIIASTNRHLEEEVDKGQFRKDLYYRLKVLPVYLYPLRERRDDIVPLAKSFVLKFNNEFKKKVDTITPEIENILVNYDWPGNVRELKNVIERAVLLSCTNTLSAEHILLGNVFSKQSDAEDMITDHSISAIENKHIQKILKDTSWRMTKAANILGINRTTLYNKIKQYNIKQ
ncbi:MAG: sigma-54-dependent Fis family transcriptional regulator [Candidatus Scalindua sp. AMX11]|nr:MAG: sigma-54-dependent Fis family transcriptional regulator [Candidatus Scalindua sp.]NOG85760.1 sigma-54-dependent Fis family transcriptional regulator [Planctomycetota bacterium]RZV97063.1 MAG: sigma-54-dependent Fis family transcriptional regulator [Candidatus Scalindua sp. SCAELEC01]TDE66323.1 MAG: sigma-54-dependent Fis family transcriptional regulator [Candidatus Scalindua sp. AMX11]GJQ58286.1 MAG: acetoacetate metabolism regulatory protein AtoC [Candidatus Scalindua sp.]